jgi:hypothetical protein
MAGKKNAPTSNPGTSMVKWEEEMEKRSQIAAAATAAASGTFVGLKAGVISIDKVPVKGNEIEAVVLSHCFENALYPGKYDPENPTSPICFAFGVATPDMTADQVSKLQDTMVPHEMSVEPQGHKDKADAGKPGGKCSTCWANQWASAEEGRGKACKNVRRLGLIAGDDDSIKSADAIAAEKVYYLKTPVMSGKNWDSYVKDVAKTLKRPPLGVVTKIGIQRDEKAQFLVIFDVVKKIDSAEQFEAIIAKADDVTAQISFPYQPPSDDAKTAAQPARGSNAGARKFAGKPAPTPTRGAGRR